MTDTWTSRDDLPYTPHTVEEFRSDIEIKMDVMEKELSALKAQNELLVSQMLGIQQRIVNLQDMLEHHMGQSSYAAH